MSGRNVRFLVGSFLMFALCGAAAAAAAPDSATRTARSATPPDPAQVRQQLGGLGVPFEANAGQADPRVAYTARTLDGTLFVTRDGRLVHSFPGKPNAEATARGALDPHDAAPRRGPGWTLTETLLGARPQVQDGAPSAVQVSRFVGNDPKRWAREVRTVERVSLGEAWPGIGVELAARGRNVEKLFTVAPGADAGRIGVRVGGARRLEIAADGALVAHTGNGAIAFTAPVAWQEVDGLRRAVDVKYALAGNRYGFRLGEYDPAHAVVIDPLLNYTYLGGAASDFLWGLAQTEDGNVYASGYASSTDFPGTAGGSQTALAPTEPDAFIALLDANLELMQATYFGGNLRDFGYSVAIARDGTVYLVGHTESTNLPGAAGGAQTAHGGGMDGFVARFSADLKNLLQSTYAGGTGFDVLLAIALDANDNVFAAGHSGSAGFPGVAGGAQVTYGGGSVDLVVVKFSADLKTRLQSTFHGGSGNELTAFSMAINAVGDVYVTGRTTSANMPATAGAAQTTSGGGTDAFVAKLSNDLKTRLRSTYVGGAGEDVGFGMTIDADDNVYVVGSTTSTNFPWVDADSPQVANGGGTDGFVAIFDGNLSPPANATYLGGSGFDEMHAVAVNPLTDDLIVVGNTASNDLPLTPDADVAVLAEASSWHKSRAAGSRVFKADPGTGGSIAEYRTLLKGERRFLRKEIKRLKEEKDEDDPDATLEIWALKCRVHSINVELKRLRCLAGGSATGGLPPTNAANAGDARTLRAARVTGAPSPKIQPLNAGGFDGFILEDVAPSYQGLWWRDPAGSESGWGINFAHQGTTIFATWFTYDLAGKPWWLAVTADQVGPGVYRGDLFTTTGPPFNAEPFDPSTVVETTIGTATFTFADNNHATFDYTVNVNAPAKLAVTQSKPITRQEFGPLPRCIWGVYPDLTELANNQDLWWRIPAGSESGWGINLTHQGDVIFATWFTYDLAGKPWWLAFVANKTAPGVYTGDVFTTAGPPFNAEPFLSSQVVETTIGTVTLTFTDGNTASFAYTVNGVSQTKQISRQVFAATGTGCR